MDADRLAFKMLHCTARLQSTREDAPPKLSQATGELCPPKPPSNGSESPRRCCAASHPARGGPRSPSPPEGPRSLVSTPSPVALWAIPLCSSHVRRLSPSDPRDAGVGSWPAEGPTSCDGCHGALLMPHVQAPRWWEPEVSRDGNDFEALWNSTVFSR